MHQSLFKCCLKSTIFLKLAQIYVKSISMSFGYKILPISRVMAHQTLIFHLNVLKWAFLKFNPILSGGGHYGPDDLERPRCFRRVRATTTKIHDFVSVYVWMVPWKSFLGFVFKIFEKRKKNFLRFRHKRVPPLEKKSKISKKIFFLEKIILFLFEFVLYMF